MVFSTVPLLGLRTRRYTVLWRLLFHFFNCRAFRDAPSGSHNKLKVVADWSGFPHRGFDHQLTFGSCRFQYQTYFAHLEDVRDFDHAPFLGNVVLFRHDRRVAHLFSGDGVYVSPSRGLKYPDIFVFRTAFGRLMRRRWPCPHPPW